MTTIFEVGPATLYLGDAREIVPTIERPAAILTDSPYGQRVKTNVRYAGGARGKPVPQPSGGFHKMLMPNEWPEGIEGDDEDFDPRWMLEHADRVLLWGEHKFGHLLPRGRRLVWDKRPNGTRNDQGDGEAAWCNVNPKGALRIFRLLWNGMCVGSAARHEVGGAGNKRVHPTQKPEALMAWCLPFLEVGPGALICDPYMGSGSTGVAAVKAGFRFVGIELVPQYFDVACDRLEQAWEEAKEAARQTSINF
jgi:site-specific DNA-methyltransferase (adenine-specific)